MKKYLLIALAAVLLVSASVVGTVAFLTDRDNVTNIFTVGKVDIEIVEAFDETTAKLIPGNDINKDVQIQNVGDTDAWVWYTYAIPAALDDANASLNILHINHAGRNWLGYQNNTKYWEVGQTEATHELKCWMVDKYVTEDVNIDGVLYNVYAVLYKGPLAAGEITTVGMTNVYFDTKVDYDHDAQKYILVENGQVTPIDYDFTNPEAVKLIINAYAIQADGFASVEEAYAAYADQWNLNASPNNP